MAYAAKTGAKHYLGRYLDAAGRTQSVRGEDGKSVRFTSKREAKHAAEEQEARVRRGTWVDPRAGQLTLTQYFEDHWLSPQ
ncbi:hypothetical protein G7072_09410 [Nocardioides sp. HDW12B]|uniref:hypothetical protein n=1 Tax=Nocardioides sp. HDW12B TaxID=2714939 RepID=UPI00140E5021|nr:hypothetical protein [Nocardioides sp. HDW12B]QIK66541.1 hypothetical protein G7072_09410 [Nocardioides sp. HDW12B]